MKISTKGQYALQIMLDLAANNDGSNIAIKSIAKRLDLSEKYLEQIVSLLSKAGFVKSVRGARGGYKLTDSPDAYTVGMILRAIEGSLAPIECIEKDDNCNHTKGCVLCGLWNKINNSISEVIDNITIQDLLDDYEGRMEEN